MQVASVRVGSSNQNELLEYIQSLGSDAELLTANASQDVLDAMTSFIDRCMGEVLLMEEGAPDWSWHSGLLPLCAVGHAGSDMVLLLCRFK